MERRRNVLKATSAPHFSRIQLVAAPRILVKFSQMQGISVVLQLDSLATASSKQGRAQLGISSRVWAWTAAARARATKAYFILAVWFVGYRKTKGILLSLGCWNE